jgi:TPP-dependent pyruvate/acetoin dehydrogenase alpha subunit
MVAEDHSRQYMGRKTGATKGKDSNMHMGSLEHNLNRVHQHAGSDNVPVATGIGLSFKDERDGTRRGLLFRRWAPPSGADWHEGLNMAAR